MGLCTVRMPSIASTFTPSSVAVSKRNSTVPETKALALPSVTAAAVTPQLTKPTNNIYVNALSA